jgi:hypothetical protein
MRSRESTQGDAIARETRGCLPGLICQRLLQSQGVALGWYVTALSGRKNRNARSHIAIHFAIRRCRPFFDSFDVRMRSVTRHEELAGTQAAGQDRRGRKIACSCRKTVAPLVFAPKGHNISAQGRAERRSRGAPPWVALAPPHSMEAAHLWKKISQKHLVKRAARL